MKKNNSNINYSSNDVDVVLSRLAKFADSPSVPNLTPVNKKGLVNIFELSGDDNQVDVNDLVEQAGDEGNPFYEEFDWDDSSAAQKYRLLQADVILCRPGVKNFLHDGEYGIPIIRT